MVKSKGNYYIVFGCFVFIDVANREALNPIWKVKPGVVWILERRDGENNIINRLWLSPLGNRILHVNLILGHCVGKMCCIKRNRVKYIHCTCCTWNTIKCVHVQILHSKIVDEITIKCSKHKMKLMAWLYICNLFDWKVIVVL